MDENEDFVIENLPIVNFIIRMLETYEKYTGKTLIGNVDIFHKVCYKLLEVSGAPTGELEKLRPIIEKLEMELKLLQK